MRESRALRGKGLLIYPGNPRAGYVRAGGRTCLASQICPSLKVEHVR
jgi:hypothetical protein